MSIDIAIIGGGPAGLMAAETAAATGSSVVIYERMPSPARKFLMAGRGGLNLTHSEPLQRLLTRYGEGEPRLRAAIEALPPDALRKWASGLGQETFVGSSGRIFPVSMKASPLLRAWLGRLAALNVRLETRSEWRGWDESGRLLVSAAGATPDVVACRAVILACGGASWPRLGSSGDWVEALAPAGVAIAPLRASNMGVQIAWSAHFADRFVGAPLKRIALKAGETVRRGEAVISARGLEGVAVYALSRDLRQAMENHGSAQLYVDLRPDIGETELADRLANGRVKDTLATRLRRSAGLSPAAAGLLREAAGGPVPAAAKELAALIKSAPLAVSGLEGLPRAISTAGGLQFSELDQRFMLRAKPGVFAAGEMLDWDAPTGGYLLQASLATGAAAGRGAVEWLDHQGLAHFS